MAISSLDTLDIAKRLKEAGFNDAQAEAVTTVFRDVRTADLAPLATKADIDRLEAATRADIQRLESEMQRLAAATKADIQRLEARMDSQIELLRRDLTIRLGSMIVIATGILLAAKFFG
jgi:50S ribosomal subunit-associated GTPase HflX